MDWTARVASDAALRSLLQAARAWGVSPRRFLGWEAARTLVYNQAGQVVRIETEHEWDDDSRALAMGLAAWEDSLCPGCRHLMSETTDPNNEDRYLEGPAIRCHRCTASERGSQKYQESPQPGALFIPVTLRPQPEETATDETDLLT